jgi:thiol:disulfide interchange protein DsbA
MTGNCETSSYDTFSYGVGSRTSSIRIPTSTFNNKCGYFEDRRPSSNMDPYLDKWADNLPKDVIFKRIPAIPRKDWVTSARAYYALESLGIVNKLHEKLFDAIHKEKLFKHNDTKALTNWIALNGKLDKKEVEAAFNSFSMKAKLSRSFKVFKTAGATGVPTMIIDGKYFTSSTMAGGEQNAIDIMNFIITNVRKDKAKK